MYMDVPKHEVGFSILDRSLEDLKNKLYELHRDDAIILDIDTTRFKGFWQIKFTKFSL